MPADRTPFFVGYHAPHERFKPSRLVGCARRAERAGFDAVMCSDHFHPWSERQGESGLAWAWLGAALQATSRVPFGSVNAPGQRYHPAIVAQAIATLAELSGGRYAWVALGTGQALNEAITGTRWPARDERKARLLECVDVIRALLAGETVTHRGRVCVEEATLYTRPETPPALFATALTPETARWAGGWADGLLTGGAPPEHIRKVMEAFREGGGEGKPIYAQPIHLVDEREEGLTVAHDQWRTNVAGPELQASLRRPSEFDAAAQFVRPEDMEGSVRLSPDPEQHLAWLEEDRELGLDGVFVHVIGMDQERSIDVFGEHVLPGLRAGQSAR